MKRWWQFLVIFWLGIGFSLGLSPNLKAQIAPSQLVQQAQVSYQRGEFKRSIQLLEQANRIYQSQAKYLQQVQVLSFTALAQQQLGEWQLAGQNLGNGLQILNSLADSDRKTQVLAQIWNPKGQFQFLRGNSDRALEAWQTAEALYRQTKDRLGVAGSLLNQAQALEKIGFYRRACDRVLEAFDRPDYNCEGLTASQLAIPIEQAKTEKELWQIEALNSLLQT